MKKEKYILVGSRHEINTAFFPSLFLLREDLSLNLELTDWAELPDQRAAPKDSPIWDHLGLEDRSTFSCEMESGNRRVPRSSQASDHVYTMMSKSPCHKQSGLGGQTSDAVL